ncbi:MAG: hypothetical protein ACRDEA_15000, partial [Microcystaceae cyanobacterium]
MVDWSGYLNSVCQAYDKWQQSYTFTDVVGRKKAEVRLRGAQTPESVSHIPLWDFDLMVQTVERDNERGEKQEKIERFSVLEGLRQYAPDHVLLVGRPGSGKSTALARLLLEEANVETRQSKSPIPVLVELRYYQKSVLELIQNFFKRHKWFLKGDSKTELKVAIPRSEAEEIFTQFLQDEKFDRPRDRALQWLQDLLNHHLIQLGADNKIEFRHQLIQEYYTAECLLTRLSNLSDDSLKREYLNYLKWTEPLALMMELLDHEAQAVRVVKLALEVDWQLGARLAGTVKPEWQERTVGLIVDFKLPQSLEIRLFKISKSEKAIPFLKQAIEHKNSYVRYR